jgi:GGDEF domain-containing protein
LPEVLDLVANKIGQLVPFRSCVIYLLEDHSDSLSARFVSGANVENLRGRALRVGEGITGWAALQKSNRFSQSVDLDLAGAGLDLSEYSTAAAFPLIQDGQVLGVITLYFPKGVPCLDDHIRMMDIIVRLAAAAVHNGTLFAETQESALTDGLTNLPNSRYLRQVFEQEKVRSQQAGQPMAFLEADLDNFKVINDRFGHHVGDRYLSEISRVLKSHLRERDILVRLSGDEFAALLPGCSRRWSCSGCAWRKGTWRDPACRSASPSSPRTARGSRTSWSAPTTTCTRTRRRGRTPVSRWIRTSCRSRSGDRRGPDRRQATSLLPSHPC